MCSYYFRLVNCVKSLALYLCEHLMDSHQKIVCPLRLNTILSAFYFFLFKLLLLFILLLPL